MKYCPGCDDEFQDSADRCEECDCELVGEQQWRKVQAERRTEAEEVFVRAAVAGDRFEADVMKNALEQEGIPVLMRTFHDTSFDGIYIDQKGWALIEVPKERFEQARSVLEALAAAQPES